MTISIDNVLFKGILLFAITTLLQNVPGLFAINQILFFVIFSCMLMLLLRMKYNYIHIIVLLALILNYSIAILNSNDLLVYVNNLFYFIFWAMYCFFCSRNINNIINFFKEEKNYIKSVIWIWSIIVVISMFFPSSYSVAWGGYVYFGSFSGGPFRLLPSVLLLLAIIYAYMQINNDKSIIIFTIVPLLSTFISGSRTYFGVIGILTLMIWYSFCKNKKKFWFSIIPFGLLLLAAFLRSSIYNKFLATTYTETSHFDYFGTVSNGRSIFWAVDLDAFRTSGFFNQLFGNGFNFVYDINSDKIGNALWAHNDFINILLNFGYLGLLIYFLSFFKLSKLIINKSKKPVLFTLFILIWLINAMFNMVYTYMCATLAIPFILIGVYFENKDKHSE